MPKRTVKVRINANLAKELKMKFPDVRTADLFQVMYDTSLLKIESGLRVNKTRKIKKI